MSILEIESPKLKIITALFLLVMFLIIIGALFFRREEKAPIQTPVPTLAPKNISPEETRDNQRVSDLAEISKALETYSIDADLFPVANIAEKISDESSNSYIGFKQK